MLTPNEFDRIRESERNLRDFFDFSPLMMGVAEVRGDDIYHVMCNPGVARLFGRTQQQMENTFASRFFRPEFVQEWVERFRTVERERKPCIFDYHFPISENASWFSVTLSPLGRTPAGSSRYSYVIANVTDRKLAEQANEVRFKTILDHSPIMIDAFDEKGKCCLWSKACEEYLGWTFEEVNQEGGVLNRLYPDSDELKRVTDSIQEADGKFREYRVRTKSGEIAYQMWANFRLPNQSNISLGYDVTERKKAEQELARLNDTLEQKVQERTGELQQSESRLRLALEANRMGCWDHDLITGKVVWSDSFIRLLGLDPSTCDPSPDLLNRMLLPGYKELIQRVVVDTIQGKRDHQIEFRIVTPEGNVRWLMGIGSPLFDEHGNVVRMIGIVMDITERKQVEAIVSEQRAKMISASKMSALGEMSSGIAHEINNPLAIIHGNARRLKDLAQDTPLPAAMVRDIAERIEATALRISKIVKALKSFAREGENDPCVEISAAQIVEEAAELCRERFRAHGIELKSEPVDPKLKFSCRPVQISQVLLNLLNNAHDAVASLKPEAGKEPPKRWVKLLVRDLGQDIEFQVIDSGPGIPNELRERIFVPFFTTKPLGQGTGLGLSVSKGIIEKHGGSLIVDPSSAQTVFCARIPKEAEYAPLFRPSLPTSH